jgi:hypothetical protein
MFTKSPKKVLFLLATLLCGYAAAAGKEIYSLSEAIDLSAQKIVGDLPKGTRVVVAEFKSESDSLSAYIIDEL